MSKKLTDVDLWRFDERLAEIKQIRDGEQRANAIAALIESVADWPFGEEFVAKTIGPALERYQRLTDLLDPAALLYTTLSPDSFLDPWTKVWRNVLQKLEQLLLTSIRARPGCANFQLAPSEDLGAQIKQFHSPKLAFDRQFFGTLATLDEAQAYIRTLPWDQRLQIWRVPQSEWRFAKKLNPSNPLNLLRGNVAYLSLSDAGPPPTQKQIDELAVTIYRVVKRARKLAKREGKPLRIVAVGLDTCEEGRCGTNLLTGFAARLDFELIVPQASAIEAEIASGTSAYTLVFNTSHRLYNLSTRTNSQHLADAAILGRHNLKELATGKKIIQIVMPGGEIRSDQEAFALSRGAQEAFSIRSVLIAEFTELLLKTPVRYVLGFVTGTGAGVVATTVTQGNAVHDSLVGAAAGIGAVKIASYARTKKANRIQRSGASGHSPIAKTRR
jgi:hypothetical protein